MWHRLHLAADLTRHTLRLTHAPSRHRYGRGLAKTVYHDLWRKRSGSVAGSAAWLRAYVNWLSACAIDGAE